MRRHSRAGIGTRQRRWRTPIPGRQFAGVSTRAAVALPPARGPTSAGGARRSTQAATHEAPNASETCRLQSPLASGVGGTPVPPVSQSSEVGGAATGLGASTTASPAVREKVVSDDAFFSAHRVRPVPVNPTGDSLVSPSDTTSAATALCTSTTSAAEPGPAAVAPLGAPPGPPATLTTSTLSTSRVPWSSTSRSSTALLPGNFVWRADGKDQRQAATPVALSWTTQHRPPFPNLTLPVAPAPTATSGTPTFSPCSGGWRAGGPGQATVAPPSAPTWTTPSSTTTPSSRSRSSPARPTATTTAASSGSHPPGPPPPGVLTAIANPHMPTTLEELLERVFLPIQVRVSPGPNHE